jgi:hypothetical protein
MLGMRSPTRPLALAGAVLASALIVILPPGEEASATHGDCRVSAEGPFIYVDMVFPVTKIECDTVKQGIHVEATLANDGSLVATASRTCRKTNICWLALASDGIFTHDVPGDQRWCGTATGSINNRGSRHSLAQAASCEAETF